MRALQRFRITLLAALLLALVCPSVFAKDDDAARFSEWQQRLQKGEHEAWKEYLPYFQGKPLFPYLQYMQLTAELSDWSLATIEEAGSFERTRAFLDVWPELPVSDNLRRQWIRRLGKEQHWQALLKVDITEPPTDISCLRLRAEYQLGSRKQQKKTLAKAKSVWLVGRSQPKRCDALFALLKQHKKLDSNDYLERAKNALALGEVNFARWLNKQLPSAQKQKLKPWFSLYNDPSKLAGLLKQTATPDRQRLANVTMRRLARQQPQQAAELFARYVSFSKPDPNLKQSLWRRLAIFGASDYHPKAQAWFDRAQLQANDSLAWGWYMRSALANKDWPAIMEIASKPLELDRKTRLGLRYWQAVAAEKLGRQEFAEDSFKQLSVERDWYGYLAADQLGLDYAAPEELPRSDAIQRGLLMSFTQARRARDLKRAKLEWLARGEWLALMKVIPNTLHQEAALLALELNWPSMAARTQAVHTSRHPDETLFPTPWQRLVSAAEKTHGVKASHIWSQMRAESLFMPDARSGVGASGLMQLMPKTAENVGKRLKLDNWRRLPLRDPATNIQLGARYIAEMLEQFDERIPLAVAAYNAGPHRVAKWLEERPYNDPVLWIEQIPFSETRRYVQRSLYFHVRYDARLGSPSRTVSELLQPTDLDLASSEQ
jgi:soluble lytic murein transglycosylase